MISGKRRYNLYKCIYHVISSMGEKKALKKKERLEGNVP